MKHTLLFLLLLAVTLLTAQDVRLASGTYTDVVYVDSRDALYAVGRPGLEGVDPGSLCRVDPASGELLTCLELSEQPSLVRATTSGDYLYVAFRASNRIVRIDLSSETIDRDYRLGAVEGGAAVSVLDILPLRGSNDELLIASGEEIECCGFFSGLLLTNGAGDVTASLPSNFVAFSALAYTAQDRSVIAYNAGYVYGGVQLVTLTEDGGLQAADPTYSFQEYQSVIEYGTDGRLYSSGGGIAELADGQLTFVAQLPVSDYLGYGVVAAAPAADKLYYSGYTYGQRGLTLLLTEFDASTFTFTRSYELLPNVDYGSFRNRPVLERLNATTFAFVTEDGTLGVTTLCASELTEVPPPYTGSTTICFEGSLLLTAPEELTLAEGQTIRWSDGQTGDSVYVSTPGTYNYRVVDAGGCPGPYSDPFYVGRQEYRDSPPFVETPRTDVLCVGDTVLLTGSYYYENSLVWSTGLRSDTLRVTEGGAYFAQGRDPFTGCLSEPTAPIFITAIADSAPLAPVIDQGSRIDTCTFEPILLSVSQPALEYFWTINDFFFGSEAQVQAYVDFAPNTYSVAVRDFNGCVSPSSSITVTYFQPPPTPFILYNQTTNTLVARGTLGPVRWYHNDVFEAETQSLFYKPRQSGFYSARVRGEQCLSDESNLISVEGVVSAVANLEHVDGIYVYPNPATDVLSITVDVPSLRSRQLSYTLLSVSGSVVKTGQLPASGAVPATLSVADLSAGMYVLELREGARALVRQRVTVL